MKEMTMIKMDPGEAKKAGLEIINANPVCDMTTIDESGFPQTRKMWGLGMDDDLTFYYTTFKGSPKCSQIAKHNKVNLSWHKNAEDMPNWEQIQFKATAEIKTDQALKDRFWSDMLSQFYDNKEDPDYVIIVVKPKTMIFQKMNIYPVEITL